MGRIGEIFQKAYIPSQNSRNIGELEKHLFKHTLFGMHLLLNLWILIWITETTLITSNRSGTCLRTLLNPFSIHFQRFQSKSLLWEDVFEMGVFLTNVFEVALPFPFRWIMQACPSTRLLDLDYLHFHWFRCFGVRCQAWQRHLNPSSWAHCSPLSLLIFSFQLSRNRDKLPLWKPSTLVTDY